MIEPDVPLWARLFILFCLAMVAIPSFLVYACVLLSLLGRWIRSFGNGANRRSGYDMPKI